MLYTAEANLMSKRTRSLKALRDGIACIYAMALQMFPMLFGAAIILVLLLSGQGRELVRINDEQDHSIFAQVAIAAIPTSYAFITLLIGVLFNTYRNRRSEKSAIPPVLCSNIAAFVCALAVPATVVTFFPASGVQVIAGIIFFALGAALTCSMSQRMAVDNASTRRFTRKIELIVLFALIVGCCGIAVLASDPEAAAAVGTVGVTIAALAVWMTLIAIVFGLLPTRLGWSTKYGLCILCALLVSVASKPEELDFETITKRALRLKEDSGDARNTWWAAAKQSEWSEHKRNWYNADKRPFYSVHVNNWLQVLAERESHRTGPVSIYLVSAEGGGIRAAVWTASVLSQLHKKSNGFVTANTLAYSGISGGSLGIAMFLGCFEELKEKGDVDIVRVCTNKALRTDFLAPGVARILITEPLRVIPILGKYLKSRDRAFEEAIESSIKIGELNNRLVGPMSSITSGESPNLAMSGGHGAPKAAASYEVEYPLMPEPVVPGAIAIFNAADAWTGTRISFSNVAGMQASRGGAFGKVERIDGVALLAKDASGVPVSFAVHSSARFPLFSPPGIYKDFAIVDGGYRENTGIDELKIIVEEVRRLQRTSTRNASTEGERRLRSLLDRLSINVIAITNQSYAAKAPNERKYDASKVVTSERGGVEISAPLSAVLASREVRSSDAVLDMSHFVRRKVELGFYGCQYAPDRVARDEMPTAKFTTPQGEQLYVKDCAYRPYQDMFHEVALADFVTDSLPILGWVLAKSTFDKLSDKYPQEALGRLQNEAKPVWWTYFQRFVCKSGASQTGKRLPNLDGSTQYCDSVPDVAGRGASDGLVLEKLGR